MSASTFNLQFVTVEGLAAYTGGDYAEIVEAFNGSITRGLMECEARVLAFIFPNTPRSDIETQIDAFCNAVYAQMLYEYKYSMQVGAELPKGTTGFKIGEFSMNFSDGTSPFTTLTRSNISPAAYGYLLREGLLYKGVERPCCDAVY